MSQAIPVDDLRFEVKMTAPEAYEPKLQAILRAHPMGLSRLHPPRWINNVYFDTRAFSRLNQNYAGIHDRSKLRYRWYGTETHGRSGHLEIKIKHGKLGWKQNHVCVEPVNLHGMLWREIVRRVQRSLPEDLGVQLRDLDVPVLINRYHRQYLATPDRRVRLTVDCAQRYWNQWSTDRPNFRFAAQSPGTLVVEVKANRRDQNMVERVLQRLPLRVSRNSKYVEGCEHLTSLG